MPFATPKARPIAGQPVDTAWGQEIHDLSYGTLAPHVDKLGSDGQATFPLGLSTVASCDPSWGAGCFLVFTIKDQDTWCIQFRLGVQANTMSYRSWVSGAWSAWASPT